MSTPFQCPACGGAFTREMNSLVCERRHTFDIARQGYVNLLLKKPDTLYEDKALFAARRAVYEAGFFTPMVEAIRAVLGEGMLLDAGCGEGSLLHRLAGPARLGIGLDIAKPAIQMAAASFKEQHWCVGDLCNIPLADHSVDAIVNVLTPANYASFARVLRPGGLLAKIVPNAGHLREIREVTGKPPSSHTAEEMRATLEKSFVFGAQERIVYEVPCDAALAAQVFAMTPLTAHERAHGDLPGRITVDVTLFVAHSPGGI